jgi:hypothetical protein
MPVRGASRKPESLEGIERTLAEMGLSPALEVDVDRVGRSVLKHESRGALSARLKYDKITYREPGTRHEESEVEFEIGGAEDHDAAPRAPRVSDYYNFLRDFMNQCRDAALLNEIGWIINAKYFAGLIRLGLDREIHPSYALSACRPHRGPCAAGCRAARNWAAQARPTQR